MVSYRCRDLELSPAAMRCHDRVLLREESSTFRTVSHTQQLSSTVCVRCVVFYTSLMLFYTKVTQSDFDPCPQLA